ncbi:MAG: hypothetical protein QOE61_3952, partial [Micromonosporaceae bacterium]|nr:hypothetical protein [Micromonosporaceae bacterium]
GAVWAGAVWVTARGGRGVGQRPGRAQCESPRGAGAVWAPRGAGAVWAPRGAGAVVGWGGRAD